MYSWPAKPYPWSMPLSPEHAARKKAIAERRQARSERPQVTSWPEAMRAFAERLDELLDEQDERLDALEQHAAKCTCGAAPIVRPSWWSRAWAWLLRR